MSELLSTSTLLALCLCHTSCEIYEIGPGGSCHSQFVSEETEALSYMGRRKGQGIHSAGTDRDRGGVLVPGGAAAS